MEKFDLKNWKIKKKTQAYEQYDQGDMTVDQYKLQLQLIDEIV